MAFEFIDNSDINDRAARKRIRSHAALGKNVGKKRVPRGRQLQKPRAGSLFTSSSPSDGGREPGSLVKPEDFEKDDCMFDVGHGFGDVLPSTNWQADLTPRSQKLISRFFAFVSGPMFSLDLSDILIQHRPVMWAQLVVADEAYFHSSVAFALWGAKLLPAEPEDQAEALRHLSTAFRLVNQKLSSRDALDDSTLASIISISHYERVASHYDRALVHFRGLLDMIELRGGVYQFVVNQPWIAQKTFRTDIDIALFLGQLTCYPPNVIPTDTLCWLQELVWEHQPECPLSRSTLFQRLPVEARVLLSDLLTVSYFCNNRTTIKSKLSSYGFHDLLNSAWYRVIHLGPLGGPRLPTPLENLVQLGIMGFLMCFWHGLDLRHPHFPLLLSLARQAAQGDLLDVDHQEVLLWMLFVARKAVFFEIDDAWLLPRLAEVVQSLGLRTWDEAQSTLTKFPWVSRHHEKSAMRLWNELEPHRMSMVLRRSPTSPSTVLSTLSDSSVP